MGLLSPYDADGSFAEDYPELTIASDSVSGIIKVKASFDIDSGLFYIIKENGNQPPGLILTGEFSVEIKGSIESSTSTLPLAYIAGVAHSPDRHFNQTDGAACLCSPLETDEFLQPQFELKTFLDQLVVPFLYGQLFFDQYGHWPWRDYAHGATGVLEAYAKTGTAKKMMECIKTLSQDVSWTRIEAALIQKKSLSGRTTCFCSKAGNIKRCHPDAWKGLVKLRQDVRYKRQS